MPLLALLLVTCRSSKQLPLPALPKPYLATATGGLVYDASFQYKDYQASGLLVMKRLQALEYHVVLLSKFGVGLMEFKLFADSVQWIKTFEQLQQNKKALALLERDFRMLLLSPLDKPGQVVALAESEGMQKMLVKGNPKLMLAVDTGSGLPLYTESRGGLNLLKSKIAFSYADGGVPTAIHLRHSLLNMRLDLTLLKKQ